MGRAIAAVMTKPDVGGEIKKFQGFFQRRRAWEK
jgi:hypothetical protein